MVACAASPALAQVSPWSSGTYAYDGAGNVKAIGADYYVYDQVGRLIRGTADKERSGLESYQPYTYDAFGNHSELANLVDENYRPNAKYGDGGMADSIRHEMRTGELLSPSGHAPKRRQMITAIGNVMKTGRLSASDREIAIQLASDLIKALMGN